MFTKGDLYIMESTESLERQLALLNSKPIKDRLLSDEMFDFISANMLPLKTLTAYYQCAIMEVETKFKVLNEQFSLQYGRRSVDPK